MKKRILLFTAIAGMGYLALSSYVSGPAAGGENRTGANGSPTTCGQSGCHGTGAGPTVTITVDSGATAVTEYVPGTTYIIKVHGAGSANNFFGFEFASVSGSGTSQVQAGTTSGYPTHVGADVLSGLSFVEHHAALAATSTGVYDVSFEWTAPATGVGAITLYCTLNAVNGNDIADAPDVSGNTSVMLTQATTTGVANVATNMSLKVFPNPVVNNLSVQMDNAQAGIYAIQVYDMRGRTVTSEHITVNGSMLTAAINTGNWLPGTYQVVVEKDGSRQVMEVVKE